MKVPTYKTGRINETLFRVYTSDGRTIGTVQKLVEVDKWQAFDQDGKVIGYASRARKRAVDALTSRDAFALQQYR